MRVDVLGRRRALWCSMRRWRSMLLAAAKQCVQPLVVEVRRAGLLTRQRRGKRRRRMVYVEP